MAIDVKPEILILKPRVEVAEYMFDPSHDAEWTTGVIACRPLTAGRLRQGSKVERTVKFLGRRFSYLYEVVANAGDDFVELKVENPFPMLVRYTLTDAPGGTLVSIHASGEPKGFFKVAAPLMRRMVHKNISKDLALLKARIEA